MDALILAYTLVSCLFCGYSLGQGRGNLKSLTEGLVWPFFAMREVWDYDDEKVTLDTLYGGNEKGLKNTPKTDKKLNRIKDLAYNSRTLQDVGILQGTSSINLSERSKNAHR